MPALAEDLLQLLLDRRSGRPVVEQTLLDSAIAGAVLLELLRSGRVMASAPEGRAQLRTAIVRDSGCTGDAVLDEAIGRLAQRPLTFGKAVEALATGARQEVLDLLVRSGVLRYERSKMAGIFRVDSWPATAAANGDELRASLRAVLLDGAEPDDNAAALITLLHAVAAVGKVTGNDIARSRVRAERIIKSRWADEAVHAAVKEVYTAVEKKAAALRAAVAAAAAAN